MNKKNILIIAGLAITTAITGIVIYKKISKKKQEIVIIPASTKISSDEKTNVNQGESVFASLEEEEISQQTFKEMIANYNALRNLHFEHSKFLNGVRKEALELDANTTTIDQLEVDTSGAWNNAKRAYRKFSNSQTVETLQELVDALQRLSSEISRADEETEKFLIDIRRKVIVEPEEKEEEINKIEDLIVNVEDEEKAESGVDYVLTEVIGKETDPEIIDLIQQSRGAEEDLAKKYVRGTQPEWEIDPMPSVPPEPGDYYNEYEVLKQYNEQGIESLNSMPRGRKKDSVREFKKHPEWANIENINLHLTPFEIEFVGQLMGWYGYNQIPVQKVMNKMFMWDDSRPDDMDDPNRDALKFYKIKERLMDKFYWINHLVEFKESHPEEYEEMIQSTSYLDTLVDFPEKFKDQRPLAYEAFMRVREISKGKPEEKYWDYMERVTGRELYTRQEE